MSLLSTLSHAHCANTVPSTDTSHVPTTGPKTDEFFTVSIGGMVTMLNSSGEPIHPGDLVEWCFYSTGTHQGKRQKQGPRRVGITIASISSPKVIGRALSFAKAGETLDVLLK